jgi:integrase
VPSLRVHDLRHTFASRLRRAGVLQVTISELLWHSTGSMTAHYTAGYLAPLIEAVERLVAAVPKDDFATSQRILPKLATMKETYE